ncbi:MAG: lactoylglutathione lyase [Candidatus Poribacteria bacterium]|nr:MAG: lactoylglutathione lyase [Candidatus Poribacteria bacterium]
MPLGARNPVIPGCGTHHVAVQARDWEASLKLYRDVLGMQVIAEFGSPERRILLLDTGDGSHIELFQPTDQTPRPEAPAPNDPFMHVALATSDARAAIEHVRAHGYPVTVEPRDVQLGTIRATIAFFKGPSGEIIEFFQTH